MASRIRVWLMVVLAVLAAVTIPAGQAAATPETYSFAPSGLDGAGFENVLAYSPFRDATGARPLLIGADAAGIHRSLDGGRTWVPSNGGLGDRHVAALLFSATVPGTAYAATDSGLYASADFGGHWTLRTGDVDFDATGRYQVDGRADPRPTGHLLTQATDGTTTYLFAATATQGVKRSTDDGATWERVALAGEHLRSIAVDPADPDRLFVASADTGLQLSTDARTDLTFAAVPGGPAVPEELAFVGTRLYVAGGADGIYRYNGRWHALDSGIPPGAVWGSITGFVDGRTGRDVLYVGCADPSDGRHTFVSTDGGGSWSPLHSDGETPVNAQEYGHATGWWAAGQPEVPFFDPSFVTSDIAVDPDDPGTVLVAGRGGAYAAVRGAPGVTWWPAVHGLMTTDNAQALADPGVPGRLYVANSGATFLVSEDGGRTFQGDAAPPDAPSAGDVVALDPSSRAGRPSRVYLAASEPGADPGTATVFSNPDPVADPTNWTDEALPAADRVGALAVGHDDSGDRVLLASVAGGGLYRKAAGTWAQVTGDAPFAAGEHGTLAWMPGTSLVYAMDSAGIWRSRAAGLPDSWRLISPASGDPGDMGGLVPDPQHPGVLYAGDADLGGIVRVTDARSRAPSTTVVVPLDAPGPLALRDDGALLAVDRSGGRLLQVDDPSGAAAPVTDVGGTFFAENDADSTSLSVGPDGFVYAASPDGGLTVSAPPGTVPPADATAPVAPTELAARIRQSDAVRLTWTPVPDDPTVAGYQVLRDGLLFAQADTTTWTDTGVDPSTHYWYQVQAVDLGGNVSDPSTAVDVSTPSAPPPTQPPPTQPPPTQPPPTQPPPTQPPPTRPPPTQPPPTQPPPTQPPPTQPPPTGPTIWGSSVMPYGSETYADALSRVQGALSPQIIRNYHGRGSPTWPHGTGSMPLIISFKLLPREVLDGSHDAQLTTFFAGTQRLTYWSYWHEPEDDIERGSFTAGDYRAAWAHIAAIARASGKPLRATLILMGYTVEQASHRTWTDYYPGSGVIDLIAWDSYAWNATATPESIFGQARAVSQQAGKPWAVAETGVSSVRVPDAAHRQSMLTAMSRYLATSKPAPVFVSYFDSDPPNAPPGFMGWNISKDPAAAAAWLAGRNG